MTVKGIHTFMICRKREKVYPNLTHEGNLTTKNAFVETIIVFINGARRLVGLTSDKHKSLSPPSH